VRVRLSESSKSPWSRGSLIVVKPASAKARGDGAGNAEVAAADTAAQPSALVRVRTHDAGYRC
jgi:hypothetical protein